MSGCDSFTVDKKSNIPIWVQIKQRLVFCILSGVYKQGDQLPTVRELAIELNVNYHTVYKVYRDLENSGLVEVQTGRGTYVADLSQSRFLVLEGSAHAAVSEYCSKLLELGMTPEEAVRAVADCLKVPIEINPASTAHPADAGQRDRRVG